MVPAEDTVPAVLQAAPPLFDSRTVNVAEKVPETVTVVVLALGESEVCQMKLPEVEQVPASWTFRDAPNGLAGVFWPKAGNAKTRSRKERRLLFTKFAIGLCSYFRR